MIITKLPVWNKRVHEYPHQMQCYAVDAASTEKWYRKQKPLNSLHKIDEIINIGLIAKNYGWLHMRISFQNNMI